MIESHYRRHLPILGFLILAQLLLPIFVRLYYRAVERPALVRSGAVQCAQHNSIVAENAPNDLPNDCDLVLVRNNGAETVETYYARSGREVTRVHSNNGVWISSEEMMRLNTLWFVLPGIGFLLIGCATFHKMHRTGAIFSWQLAKRPSDHVEDILYLYGIGLFLTSFAGVFLLKN